MAAALFFFGTGMSELENDSSLSLSLSLSLSFSLSLSLSLFLFLSLTHRTSATAAERAYVQYTAFAWATLSSRTIPTVCPHPVPLASSRRWYGV